MDGFGTLGIALNGRGHEAAWGVQWYCADVARSRKFLAVDGRQRIALGSLARFELYFADVSPEGVITLTPAELVPVATPKPRRRTAAKKTAAAVAEPPKEQRID